MQSCEQHVLGNETGFERSRMAGASTDPLDHPDEILVAVAPELARRTEQVDFLPREMLSHMVLWPASKGLCTLQLQRDAPPEKQPHLAVPAQIP